QGLEIGSPVKYRGVPIGTISAIDIAPDRRHVDVSLQLYTSELKRLGLSTEAHAGVGGTRFTIPDDLRTQLASQGITGVKFVSIDFFNVVTNPPAELEFETPDNTIPAAASLMKTLEDSVVQAVEQFP